MADRTVSVSLQAKVSGFIAGMRSAGAAAKQALGGATDLATKHRRALGELSHSLAIAGGAAVVGFGAAVKVFADFDAKMSQVKSLSHATAAEMQELSQAAMTAGVDIGFSASQAADAEIELVKAGVSVKDIMGGGLQGALTLAAAGQIDVAEATNIAAIAMTQFNVKGSQVPHVADLLAAGADKALGGVDDLGMALKQSGLVASQFGLSLDDTVGTLSAFANAGLLGSDAGTSFKQMLLSLANPTGKAADLMKQLGLNAYDAQGNFIGITALAGQLHDKLGGLSQAQRNAALSTIFGSDAIRAANVLYTQGAKGIQGWINAVNDQGFAAEQAAGKMDNLNGDLQKLKAAFENDLIKAGSGANSTLRDIVQGATALIKVVGQIPTPVLSVGLGLVGLLGAGTLAAAGLLKVVQVAGDFRTTMRDGRAALAALAERMAATGPVGAKLATGLKGVAGVLTGPWGIALVAGTIALGYFAAKHAEAKAQVEDFTRAIQEDSGALGENARVAVANALQQAGAYKLARQLGVSIRDVTAATLGNEAATNRVNAALARHQVTVIADARTGVVASRQLSNEGKRLQAIISGQNKQVREAVQNARDLQAAGGELTDKQREEQKTAADLANSTGQVSDAFNQAKDAASQFKDALDALNGASQSEEETNLRWHDQLVQTRKELQHGAKTLSINTAEGRKNRQAILDAVKAAQDHAAAVADQTGSVAAGNRVLAAERSQLVRVAMQSGLTRKQAERYIDALLRIPKNVRTNVSNNADKEKTAIDRYLARLRQIPRHVLVQINTVGANLPPGAFVPGARVRAQGGPIGFAGGGQIPRYAGAGEISGLLRGPGTGTSDSLLIRASNGEYMMRTAAVQFWGKPFMDFVNNMGGGGFRGAVRGTSGGGTAGAGDGAALPPLDVRVFIGDRELTDIVDVRIKRSDQNKKRRTMAGAGRQR